MLSLVEGILALDVESNAAGLVERWIPRNARPVNHAGQYPARIHVSAELAPSRADAGFDMAGKPALTLDGVSLWLRATQGYMRGTGASDGTIDTAAGEARIRSYSGGGGTTAGDAYSMLTIASAMLLLHQNCALIHAGAVAAPDGGAWLLVGDSHSGKSTTCLNLIRGGCAYVADDQVVLRETGDSIVVHGWPRDFHLDEGWERGERVGRRRTIDPLDLTSRSVREAPLAGIIAVSIASNLPTRIARVPASEALAAVVRQSPWFLAERGMAARGLGLLTRVATVPAFSLSLGLDVYTDAEHLMEVVSEAFSMRPGSRR